MSDKNPSLERHSVKLEPILVDDEPTSAGQGETHLTNSEQSHSKPPAQQVPAQNGLLPPPSHANASQVRMNTTSNWRTLRTQLAATYSSNSSSGSVIAAVVQVPSQAPALPARPKFPLYPTEQAQDRKDKDAAEYLGMHPSPHTQAVTSPPEQTSLSDYAPWNGNHVEDQMSEQVIRNGYALKQLVAHETETAKKTLSPYFKHPASLQSLSNFFSAVLQQRHDKGRVKAPSTFKPPPRVTLTDTKREVWLNDLANSSVPLRRLSRTIPHGIRGRSLLEHCLAKSVPFSRAVWLSKCVGANELRAFRRKGVTPAIMLDNEQKWVREWTAVVEGFVEEIFSLSQQMSWRQKASYTLRLTSHFFAERLLDREHFLDWSLNQLENSDIEKLPLVLLTIQITQCSFATSLKHGRRLATVCLEKLDELLSSPGKDLFLPLLDRLKKVILDLALHNPDCLLIRKAWKRCRDTFLCLAKEIETSPGNPAPVPNSNLDFTFSRILNRVADENDCLSRATDKLFPPKQIPSLTVIEQLDKLDSQMPIARIVMNLRKILPEVRQVILIVVQWTTSLYRSGLHRVFIAARLIRHYRREGHDTDACILSGWSSFDSRVISNQRNLGRLIAELIRSGDFNATRFLRWLIAKGGVSDQDTPSVLRVLRDMPASSLQSNVAGLRRMLLQGYRPEDFTNNSAAFAKQVALGLLADMSGATEDSDIKLAYSKFDPSALSCCDIFEISDYIRQSYPLWSSENTATGNQQSSEFSSAKPPKLSMHVARSIMALLDLTGDIITLASILPTLILESDVECLLEIAKVVEHNLGDLRSAGVCDSLGIKLCERYRILRRTRPPQRNLLLHLNSLCLRIRSCTPLLPRIKQELASCDNSVGFTAHTPTSDVQIENSGEADNELELILSWGVIKDSTQVKRALDSVFAKSLKLPNDDQNIKTLMSVLSTLQIQNESSFKEAIVRWFQEQFTQPGEDLLRNALEILISAGCFDLDACVALIEQSCDALPRTDLNLAIAGSFKALQLFCPSAVTGLLNPITRETIMMQTLSGADPKMLLPFLARCFDTCDHEEFQSQLHDLVRNDAVVDIIRRLIVDDQVPALQLVGILESKEGSAPAGISKSLLTSLLDPSNGLGFNGLADSFAIPLVFDTVNGLSLQVCQLYLRCVTSSSPKSLESRKSLATACLEVLMNSQARECPFWRRLVTSLDEKVAREIFILSESRLLLDSSRPTNPAEQGALDPRYWSILMQATAFSISNEGNAEAGQSLERQCSYASSLLGSNLDAPNEAVQHWVQAICYAVLMHSRSCALAGTSITVLQALCTLLSKGAGRWTSETDKSIFDAAAYMVEELPVAAFTQIRNNLGQLSSEPRIRFLFGIQQNPDGWLFAIKIPPAPAPPQSSSQVNQNQEQISQAFPLRRWELLPDLAQNTEANDTALSMRLFDASRIEAGSNEIS